MTELRKQFEAMPEIETHLNHGNVFWSDENKTYASEFQSLHVVACYVNGAWYAFQEQQKIIDMQECGATEIQMILDDNEYNDATKLERIKELLK